MYREVGRVRGDDDHDGQPVGHLVRVRVRVRVRARARTRARVRVRVRARVRARVRVRVTWKMADRLVCGSGKPPQSTPAADS